MSLLPSLCCISQPRLGLLGSAVSRPVDRPHRALCRACGVQELPGVCEERPACAPNHPCSAGFAHPPGTDELPVVRRGHGRGAAGPALPTLAAIFCHCLSSATRGQSHAMVV